MGQINRSQIITLSNAAYQLEQYGESRKILVAWLHKYPNDLWIRYRLAIILYKLGEFEKAIRLCELIVSEDPEFYEVWGLLAVLYPELSSDRKLAEYRARKLQNAEEKKEKGLKALFKRGKQANQEELTVENDEFDILTAVNNAKLLVNDDDRVSSSRILNIYYRRWPHTIQFKLILGHILNQMQRDDEGMAIIQSAVNADITGQVGGRIWTTSNPYKNLWVDPSLLSMEVENMKLSPEIVRLAGLENLSFLYDAAAAKVELVDNALVEPGNDSRPVDADDFDDESDAVTPGKEPSRKQESSRSDPSGSSEAAPSPVSRDKKSENQLFGEEKYQISGSSILSGKGGIFGGKGLSRRIKEEQIPIGEYVYKLKESDADNRKPVYVIMSSIAGLNRKYGANNKDFINNEMHAVADAISNRKGWTAQVFYPDEYASVGTAGPSANMLHQELVKLDNSLKEKGQMIGALLIVGGDDVVPFFSLKNPTGDSDVDVPSDAPYGALDSERCYEMQWPVGRIPGDGSSDTGLLMEQLRNIQDYHILRYSSQKTSEAQKKNKKNAKKTGKCFGYTCAAWITPSTIVYKTIADSSSLSVCPATTAANFPLTSFDSCDYAYFNLHGIKGQPNWYGQKRNDDTSGGPRIPVALEINNVTNITNTPKVVFAECCYGAETPKRFERDCMSLHFLGKATRVFVGSTTIAYGALNATLVAADLLGYLFWKHLLTGVTCGEAFRRAKKNLATEREQKNGGLDAEIQKTLLSFVFYGDPLYSVDENADINNIMQRSKTPRAYELLGEESSYENVLAPEMSSDIYKEVKQAYNISSAADEYSQCMVKKEINYNLTGRYTQHALPEHSTFVITYIKDIRVGNALDRSVIRVTVRDDGRIQKVSFSR